MRMNAFGLLTDSADTICRIGGQLQTGLPGLSGQKRGQPFRITQSQLREVAINVGLSVPKIKPYFNDF